MERTVASVGTGGQPLIGGLVGSVMGMVIRWQNAEEEVYEETGGSDTVFFPNPYDDESFPLLRCIDEYGDTFFSRRQMIGFRPELARLIDDASSVDQRRLLERIDALVEQ